MDAEPFIPMPHRALNPDGLHQRYYIAKIIGTEALLPAPLQPGSNYRPGREWQPVANGANIPVGTLLRPIYGPVSDKAEYFVLRLDAGGKDKAHIAACRIAVHAYAGAIEGHLPLLAKELRERYPLL